MGGSINITTLLAMDFVFVVLKVYLRTNDFHLAKMADKMMLDALM